jgi:hypothetical protein
MMRNPHRSGIEVMSLIEGCSLARTVLFTGGASTNGKHAAARPRPRLEDPAVEAKLTELVRDGHTRQSRSENHDTDARDAAREVEWHLRRRGEKTQTAHGLVGERHAAGGSNPLQESASCESHP